MKTHTCNVCFIDLPDHAFTFYRARGNLYRRKTCRQCRNKSRRKIECKKCFEKKYPDTMVNGICKQCRQADPLITKPTPVMLLEKTLCTRK